MNNEQNFRKTHMQDGLGCLCITENGHDCYRDFVGPLIMYWDEQYKLYGSKETLAALIKHRYHITPGKYVRTLGDTVFFFPTKTGLPYLSAANTWSTEYWYAGPLDGLVSFRVCDMSAATLERFRHSFGYWDDVRGLPEKPLLLYQYGRLYCVAYENPAGRFWVKDITDILQNPCYLQAGYASLKKGFLPLNSCPF